MEKTVSLCVRVWEITCIGTTVGVGSEMKAYLFIRGPWAGDMSAVVET